MHDAVVHIDVAYTSDPSTIIASTDLNNEGDFYINESDLAGIENRVTGPNDFRLDQNYPNPFNPLTAIEYNIPSAGFVSLNIYNILGQKVRTLISRELPQGHGSVTWDGTNDRGVMQSSGIYVYRLGSGSWTQTRKMVLEHGVSGLKHDAFKPSVELDSPADANSISLIFFLSGPVIEDTVSGSYETVSYTHLTLPTN